MFYYTKIITTFAPQKLTDNTHNQKQSFLIKNMPSIKNFDELTAHLASKGTKSRVAVVWAEDDVTRSAVLKALEAGIITVTFVGCRQEIEADERLAQYKSEFSIIDASDRDDAAAKAVAEVREDRANVLRKGGFRLKRAMPTQMAFARLLEGYLGRYPEEDGLHQVFIDIGYEQVTVHLFQGAKFKASKTIDFGCRDIDETIAELKNVDRHVASTYKDTNFEDVLDSVECMRVYDQLCFEINKVINFYNFSNADNVERMYLLGGGIEIKQLFDVIVASFGIPLETAVMVLPPEMQNIEKVGTYTLAIAAMLEGEAVKRGA